MKHAKSQKKIKVWGWLLAWRFYTLLLIKVIKFGSDV
jgi:hypothetical protein